MAPPELNCQSLLPIDPPSALVILYKALSAQDLVHHGKPYRFILIDELPHARDDA